VTVPARPWRVGALAAFRITARRPRLWAFALLAFLARGGLAVLLFPMLVLPTFVGIANAIGPASVTPGGLAPRLVATIAAGVVASAALVLAGTTLAAAAETSLHRATVAPDPGRDRPPEFMALAPRGTPGQGVARVVVIRLLLLVPVAAMVAAGVPAWIAAGYHELTVPSDVSTPLVLRVLAAAPAVTAMTLVAWLLAEVIGGFAARRAVLFGASVPRALGRGVLDTFRRPLGTSLSVVAAVAVGVAALVPAAWIIAAAWEVARRTLTDGTGPGMAIGVATVLAGAWAAALVLAAISATARATLITAELFRREPAGGLVDRDAAPSAAPASSRHADPGRPV
jgi:hypothetical protein